MTCVKYDQTTVVCMTESFPLRRIMHCPICNRLRRFAVLDPGGWYSADATCCGCGDSWCDGELGQRPFARAWRKAVIARAKETWAKAGQYTKADYKAWLDKRLEEAT